MDASESGEPPVESPETLLDALRDHREWDEQRQENQLARIVEQFPVERLREAVRARLRDLGGADGEAILRLVEAYATPGMIEELAIALLDQPDLAPERAYLALALLEGSGSIHRYPELVERWNDLEEVGDDEGALATLVEQLEEEPDGSWVALQALGAVEPEIRAEILKGLAESPTGPGLVAFLRILAFAHDPTTRRSAIEALDAHADDLAWVEIAHDHPDAEVRAHAIRRLGPELAEFTVREALDGPHRPRPEVVGSLVTALDGSGRGSIVLASKDRGKWIVASFQCDVWAGVVDAIGQVGVDPSAASDLFEQYAGREGANVVEDVPDLALGLLGGSLLLCGPDSNPVLRYWHERTAGPEFQPRAFQGIFSDDDLASHALDPMAESSWLILEACPDWVDVSPMTFDLAEEVALRSGEFSPDPRRDAGAYRFLFEHRLVDRLEHYRRMMLWMASFWHAQGDASLARSALELAWQLSDPQHAVPGHPFMVALTTKSLEAAQANLRAGRDPRPRSV